MSGDQPRYSIIGAGLCGALLANFLARAGRRVDVYEQRDDPRVAGVSGGRSINLAISERGLDALRRIGLEDKVLALATPMRGRMIHSQSGEITFQPYDRDPRRCINSISRGELNIALLDALSAHPNVRVHFRHKAQEIDLDRPGARLLDLSSDREVHASADVLIGADGAFSHVRRAMQRREGFNYSQEYLEHGYKELHIPAAPEGGFRMAPNALHIWPRRAFMMIALPNRDGSFTCTCFWPLEGPNSFGALKTDRDVGEFFERVFPDAVPLMPTLVEDFRVNPTSTLVTVRCGPWRVGDRVVLIGDAAHAIVPFYGQGMNAGFEDCVALDECLRSGAERGAAFAEFERRRKPQAEAIADLALHNFIEMRDHSASRLFRAYKHWQRFLQGLFPRLYVPLYTMVSFTTIPYAQAVARARRQDRIVAAICGLALLGAVAAIARLALS